MKVFSSLQEEHALTGDRTLSFVSSSDPQPHQASHSAAVQCRSSTPISEPTSSSASPVQSNIKVFQSSPETSHVDHRFPDKIERDRAERQHSPVFCWTNVSPIPLFTPSRGSTIHALHQEEQSPGKLTMRVPTCDPADRQATKTLDSSSQATPAKSRRQACCWKACGKKFPSQKELAEHVNEEHVRFECPEIDFQCHWQGCPREGKGFNARYKMLIHIRTHTNEKPHMCVVCGKSFSRLENLKIHTRSHTGERPYSCTFPGCSKAYSNSSDRFKHIRTHQEQKPYKCKLPGCRKQYTDPSSLRKHVRTHKHTLDSSRMDLHHSLTTDTHRSDFRICSSSRDIDYYHENVHVCELQNYISTVRHRLEQQCLTNVSCQPIQTIQKACVDINSPKNGKANEGLTKAVCEHTFADDDKKFSGGFRDVLGALKFISQHQSVNSHVKIQEPCPCSTNREQSMNYIKGEPQSSTESPVSANLETSDEQLWNKECKIEENKKLTCSNDDLRKRNESIHCVSVLPTNDISNTHSLLFCSHESIDCSQETKMTSCPTSPVLPAACCSKFPRLEHWKKRKLLISEQELQASLQSSPPPTLSPPQQSLTVPVPPIPMSNMDIPLQSSVPSNFSHLPKITSIAPHINRNSPLPHSHLSSISHCPASPKQTSPQAASTPSAELSPSLPLLSSALCHTKVPSFYSLHPNHPPLHPLFSDSHSHFPVITHTVTPPPFYTHSSSSLTLSESPLISMPNTCHYNRPVDHYLGMSPDYLLPCSPTLRDFQHPRAKQAWQHHGFNCLPTLMTLEDSLGSAVNFPHFTNSLRLVYQGLPRDFPSLYQSHASRFPLYLGVNR